MEKISENEESLIDLAEASEVINFSLCYNDNENDFFDIELSLDDTNSKLISEKGSKKYDNVLHYRIVNGELLCIPVSDNNLEKYEKIENLMGSCYSGADPCNVDLDIDRQEEDIFIDCPYESDGHSEIIRSDWQIDLKMSEKGKLKNVDSRLKNIISDNYTGPYIKDNLSFLKKKQKKREYRCNIGNCKRTFLHVGSLKQHQLLHNEKKFKCKYCGKVLCDIYRLKSHESAHFNEEGCMIYYPCLVADCNDVFCSYELLRNHENSHDLSTNPFVCEVCDKHFKIKNQYMTHLLIHDTESSFNCLECGKCFPYKAGLRAHQRNHLLVKKFCCSQCGADFVKYSNFLRHSEIHKGKRHICKICKSSYNYSRTLTKHMVKEHPIARIKELELQKEGKRKKRKLFNCLRKFQSHFMCKDK